MVGTLIKMIASPTINKKALEEGKTSSRSSPVQATLFTSEENDPNITDCKDNRAVVIRQNGGNDIQDTSLVYDDEDDIDNDITDTYSLTFQCSCKVWSCTQCNKAFSSARALKIHEVKQHENMPKRYMKCSHCDEVFDHGNLLQIHMKVHHNIKVQCPQCKELPKPVNPRAQQADPMCPVCGVKFDHDKLLKLHMEHYHKVSRKDALPTDQHCHKVSRKEPLPHEQQTFQPVATLLSPNHHSSDSRSPNSIKRTPSPRLIESRFPHSFRECNNEDSNSRNSISPREISSDREAVDQRLSNSLYPPRSLLTIPPQSNYYLPFHDAGTSPYGVMGYYPQGVKRSLEKRPLGRSHSFPLKQDMVYRDVPIMPWQMPDAGYPIMFGMSQDKKIDRASLEAFRNSLKAKLRSVEETLLREDTKSRQAISPNHQELYEDQRYFRGREEEISLPYRPSVITPRTMYSGAPFKRHAPPSDLEPTEKIRALDKARDSKCSPSRSPSQSVLSFSPNARDGGVPGIFEPHDVPKQSRDDLAIPNLQRELFDDQPKIFIKRGAPRCNRCQQTFCSKMEYLHHLISHKEKDGLLDASPEEMEFIEDVKRSMDNKNFGGEMVESRYRTKSTSSSGSPSPSGKSVLEINNKSPVPTSESVSGDKGSEATSPAGSTPNTTGLGTECVECKDVFADTASYQSHIEKRHMKPRCRECGLTFDHKNLLKIHMDCYHSSLEVLQCYYCGMSFKQRSAFLDHVTTHETQDIKNRDRVDEQSNDVTETGGRRRWGRLVASAQLPAEKHDLRDRQHGEIDDRLGVRAALALKSHAKQKLRKTVSLSTYTDMINKQRRNHSQLINETRSKGDEAIGKEMRTQIFLPNFEDKMENLSRFASSSVQLAKKRVSPPPPRESQVQGDYMFNRNNLSLCQDSQRTSYNREGRAPFNTDSSKQFPRVIQKRKLVRLKRSAPVDEDEHTRSHLAYPHRKAFVRDEVENLYQMRHKKAFSSTDVSNCSVSDPLDHRNALVKIERVEVDPPTRQAKPLERSNDKIEVSQPPSTAVKQHVSISNNAEALKATECKSVPRKLVQPIVSAVSPPPLIDTRRCTQTSTEASVTLTDSRPDSSSATHMNLEVKVKLEASLSSPPFGESHEREGRGKRRNSIKKLTKEALINSLSLKRRASAPDLYQLHHDNSTENTRDDKMKNDKCESSSGTSNPESPYTVNERTASPSMDTKHHGSRSLYYTPRRQSDRDVTCVQCGVSFGHKKLYKIHLDSYHGKQQEHECLKCGAKNFQNKDQFLKHLMAHQNDGRMGDDIANQDSPGEKTVDVHKDVNDEGIVDNGRELNIAVTKLKNNLGDLGEVMSSEDERSQYSPLSLTNDPSKSKDHSKASNNAKDGSNTTCQLCGKQFENGKQLEQHFSSHAMISEDGRFCCVICNKPFETLRKLEVHSRSHTGFKPHKCEQCGRCFPYYSSYYYHKMTHTKDRPHKCPICGKGFIQTRYLRSHLTTHKDDQGSLSDDVESIIRKAELSMTDETDEESIESPGTAESSPGYCANDEETATAEILCSFKRGLNCSAQNSDSEQSPVMLQSSIV